MELYDHSTHKDSHLFNGTEYKENPRYGEGHPFFIDEEFKDGTILYDDQLYENVPLLFDILRGDLVTERTQDGARIRLVPEKISYFIMQKHTFVRLVAQTYDGLPRTDFYEVLHRGNTSAYALHQKKSNDRVSMNRIETTIDVQDRYFIYKDGKYKQVKTKRSVLKILFAKKSQLKQFIKGNKIRFSEDRDLAITRITEYYDRLQN